MPENDPPPAFAVQTERRGPLAVLTLVGELDLASSGAAMAAFTEAMQDAPAAVVFDLQTLDFMDSSGLNCLISAKAAADAAGVRFAVLNGSGPPHRLLELSGMDSVIEMVDHPSQFDPPLEGASGH